MFNVNIHFFFFALLLPMTVQKTFTRKSVNIGYSYCGPGKRTIYKNYFQRTRAQFLQHIFFSGAN